ncbi:MAG TPA: class I SAM-dependent methyltransferase [Acetobacteraceae bacterium]|jgi:SAM-dependent methyltransferase
MIAPIPFQPRRFRTAAEHYRVGRAPYPEAVIRRVAATLGLCPTHRLLDLGCGPGPLAVAFAPYVSEVVALDPEPAMLAAGRDAACGIRNIRFTQGSSYDFGPDLGRFFLVTMGRSFHWMDRVDTLRRLDAMIEPGGAIALFHDSQPDVPDNAWRQEYDAVLKRYTTGDGRRRGWRATGWVRHEAVLLDSAFSRLELAGAISRRRVPVARLIDRALSMSSTSHARIGDQANAMVAELRAMFARIAPEGSVTEVLETTALLAWRLDDSAESNMAR